MTNVGSSNVIAVTPTIQAAAYSAGNVVGGIQKLAGAARVAGGVCLLQSLEISDNGNQKAAFDILLFDRDPTIAANGGATVTDKSAFAWGTSLPNIVGRIPVAATDYVTVTSKAVAQLWGLARMIRPLTLDLYAAIVTSGTPTYTTVSDLVLRFGFLRD